MATPLSYRLYGAAPRVPLVLLHAYPLDARMWDAVITQVHSAAPGLSIMTVDAPGFGDSPSGHEVADLVGHGAEPSLETYAEAVEQTLLALNIDRLVLAGLSLGGYAALAYVERYAEKVAGLGLLDTKAEADTEEGRQLRVDTAAAVSRQGTEAIAGTITAVLGPTSLSDRPGVVEHLRREIAQAPAEGVAWIQRAMAARPDRLHVLSTLNVPALVLRGDEDALSSAEASAAMATALETTTVTLPGVGHMAANEAPEQVADALVDLYQRAIAVA